VTALVLANRMADMGWLVAYPGVAMQVTVTGAGTGRRGQRMPGVPARRRGVIMMLAAVAAVACAGLLTGWGAEAGVAPTAAGTHPAGTHAAGVPAAAAGRVHWGRAQAIPGLAALNKGYHASVTAISCWGAGGCVAAGYFTDRDEHSQAFVARERKGRWAKATEVPGTAALNKGGNAAVGSVSCARTSVCIAAGTYTDQAGNQRWFTVTERDGRWAAAAPVPQPTLNDAAISLVSCTAAGVCAAGGTFTGPSNIPEAWVMTTVNGRWHPALEVPGITALNVGPYVSVDALSCASAGNCVAGGQYSTCATCITDNGYAPTYPYLVTEAHGTWGTAEEVPGLGTLLRGGADADTTVAACPSAGNCAAAGYYQPYDVDMCQDTSSPRLPSAAEPFRLAPDTAPPPPDGCSEVFAINERHGTWVQLTYTSAFSSYVGPLTCPAAGDCVVGGIYETGPFAYLGMVKSETNDHWSHSVTLAGTQRVNSVSCASAGYCAAGGTNDAGSAFVISEWHGTWGKAVTPPGIPVGYNSNETGGATVNAVACPPRITLCVAGGSETPADSNRAQAFIESQEG
jgi:hypothetical protein